MNIKKAVLCAFNAMVVIAIVQMTGYAQTEEETDGDWNNSCRDAGFEDGQNGPFNDATYDHCGDEATGDQAYLDGFIDGCMSVEGTTRDVCESATDG
jgi:hypothetical protein